MALTDGIVSVGSARVVVGDAGSGVGAVRDRSDTDGHQEDERRQDCEYEFHGRPPAR